jgi:hypothetical protein
MLQMWPTEFQDNAKDRCRKSSLVGCRFTANIHHSAISAQIQKGAQFQNDVVPMQVGMDGTDCALVVSGKQYSSHTIAC